MGLTERRIGLLFAVFLILLLVAGARTTWLGGVKGPSLQRLASTQQVVELKTDCDQDVILVRAAVSDRTGTCHTGRESCFYRSVPLGGTSIAAAAQRSHRVVGPVP